MAVRVVICANITLISCLFRILRRLELPSCANKEECKPLPLHLGFHNKEGGAPRFHGCIVKVVQPP